MCVPSYLRNCPRISSPRCSGSAPDGGRWTMNRTARARQRKDKTCKVCTSHTSAMPLIHHAILLCMLHVHSIIP